MQEIGLPVPLVVSSFNSALDHIVAPELVDEADELLKAYMAQLRDSIATSPYDAATERRLRDLYGLQMLDTVDSLGEKTANLATILGASERLETIDLVDGLGAEDKVAARQAGEAAMLLEMRDALYGERYDEASERAASYGANIEEPAHRREFLLMQASLLEYEGRIMEALGLVAEARKVDAGEVSELDMIEELLKGQLAETTDIAAAGAAADRTPALAMEALPTEFALDAAYPNPFNPQTTVPFRLPEAAEVHIEVFDVTGRRVALLADGPYEAGAYSVTFDAGRLSSGIYLVRARFVAGDGRMETQTRTLTLMK